MYWTLGRFRRGRRKKEDGGGVRISGTNKERRNRRFEGPRREVGGGRDRRPRTLHPIILNIHLKSKLLVFDNYQRWPGTPEN
jgi:hypothetical protein